MEVKPHEQIMIMVDGSWRLTLRNRRFIRKLDPRKTSLEDYHPTSSAVPAPMPTPGRMRQFAVTPPTWMPPVSLFSTSVA